MLQKPETNTPDQCYKRGENAATKCDPTTKCLRAVPELSEYCPTFGAYKMPNQLYGISISDYQNYGSLQNAGDQGYDLLQNHSPWSLCTGPRLTYFVAVIPTGIIYMHCPLPFCSSLAFSKVWVSYGPSRRSQTPQVSHALTVASQRGHWTKGDLTIQA